MEKTKEIPTKEREDTGRGKTGNIVHRKERKEGLTRIFHCFQMLLLC